MGVKRLLGAASVVFAAQAAAAVATASAAALAGAGSPLLAPLAADWAQAFQNATGNSVTYAPVGSGGGVQQSSGGTVDFGASDAPLSAYTGECAGCTEIPWALTATGVAYNIPGVSARTDGTTAGKSLKLTGSVLARIYLGQITTWNAPAIAKLNRGLTLPPLKITPVWRIDASGDTYAFTNFLAQSSRTWASSKGFSTTSMFAVGLGESLDAGVANAVRATRGAIGYIGAGYLETTDLATAAIRNSAGRYEQPGVSTMTAAAAGLQSFPSTGVSLVDPPKGEAAAYPISEFTYAIVPKSPAHLSLLQSFLTFAVTTGRSMGIGDAYAPIPAAVQTYDETQISAL